MLSSSPREQWAQALSTAADAVTDVLLDEHDLLSEHSHAQLAWVARGLNACAAQWTAPADRAALDLTTTSTAATAAVEEEERWVETWWDHVGAIHCYWWRPFVGHHADRALGYAHLAWVDELDSMTDAQLLAAHGIGAKSLARIRHALDVYYWRGEAEQSRELWEKIAAYLRERLEYRYLTERERVLAGIAFADQVLADEGRSLADRSAPRRIA